MSVLPKRGDFAAVRTSGEGSKAIRIAQFLSGSGFKDYEHAVFCIEDGIAANDGNPPVCQIIEAMPGGARVRMRNIEDTDLWSSGRLELTEPQRMSAPVLAQKYIGVPYSVMDYFALAEHHFHVDLPVHHRGHWQSLEDYVQSTGHMICSQLVDQLCLEMGEHLFPDGRWCGYVKPADLANLLLGIPLR